MIRQGDFTMRFDMQDREKHKIMRDAEYQALLELREDLAQARSLVRKLAAKLQESEGDIIPLEDPIPEVPQINQPLGAVLSDLDVQFPFATVTGYEKGGVPYIQLALPIDELPE
jgi:hypothetical protein